MWLESIKVVISCFIYVLTASFPLGPRCSEPCSEGLWGRHCNQTCFKHCPNSDTCLRETGTCVCRPGYWGVTCQNSERCIWWVNKKNDLKTRSLYALSNISPTVSLRMQNGYVRWPVQYDVSVLRPIIPLPSCDRRVWLSTWIHWAKLWPRWAFSLISSHHKKLSFTSECRTFSRLFSVVTVCPAGYFGKQCSEVCLPCANNSTCNHRNGHCECLPGWTAIDCSKRECHRISCRDESVDSTVLLICLEYLQG